MFIQQEFGYGNLVVTWNRDPNWMTSMRRSYTTGIVYVPVWDPKDRFVKLVTRHNSTTMRPIWVRPSQVISALHILYAPMVG